MRYSTETDFEVTYFATGEVNVVDVEWKHWPLMTTLTSVPGTEALRSVAFHLYGIANFEGRFLSLIADWQEAQQKKVKLLESESGAVVGCATIEPNRVWRDKTYLLDVFVHPNFVSHHATLVNALDLPAGKIQCYVDASSPGEKIAALQQAGFKREALLKNQFTWNDEWFDVFVYSRFSIQ